MSKSTYMKWMTEAYLYEADDDKEKEKSKGDEEEPKVEPKKPMAISQTGGFDGDTGTDADFQGEPPEGAREPEDVEDEDDEERSGEKDESIKVINGKKYRPIKEEKKPKQHIFKEQYDRLFTNRIVL